MVTNLRYILLALFLLVALAFSAPPAIPASVPQPNEPQPTDDNTNASMSAAHELVLDQSPLASVLRPFVSANLDNAKWIVGPRSVRLDGPAVMELPAGYRYLAYEELQAELKKQNLESQVAHRFGLLLPDSGAWAMRVMATQQGYVPTDGIRLEPLGLLMRLQDDGTDALAKLSTSRNSVLSNFSSRTVIWLSEPKLDMQAHSVDWAYKDLSTRGGIREVYFLNGLVLGRRWAVSLEVKLSEPDRQQRAPLAQKGVDQIIQTIRFDTGENYPDAKPSDVRAAIPLDQFIAPPESEASKAMGEKIVAATRPDFSGVFLKLLMFLPLIAAAILRCISKKDTPTPDIAASPTDSKNAP